MLHLAFLVVGTLGAHSDVVAEPETTPIALGARFGLLAIESSATTRSPAFELTVGATWDGLPYGGVALSYRGALRNVGNGALRFIGTVHRAHVSTYAITHIGPIELGAELGGHPYWETFQFRIRGKGGKTRTRSGFGAGLDVWGGVHLDEAGHGDSALLAVRLGAYNRADAIDLTANVGIAWPL